MQTFTSSNSNADVLRTYNNSVVSSIGLTTLITKTHSWTSTDAGMSAHWTDTNSTKTFQTVHSNVFSSGITLLGTSNSGWTNNEFRTWVASTSWAGTVIVSTTSSSASGGTTDNTTLTTSESNQGYLNATARTASTSGSSVYPTYNTSSSSTATLSANSFSTVPTTTVSTATRYKTVTTTQTREVSAITGTVESFTVGFTENEVCSYLQGTETFSLTETHKSGKNTGTRIKFGPETLTITYPTTTYESLVLTDVRGTTAESTYDITRSTTSAVASSRHKTNMELRDTVVIVKTTIGEADPARKPAVYTFSRNDIAADAIATGRFTDFYALDTRATFVIPAVTKTYTRSLTASNFTRNYPATVPGSTTVNGSVFSSSTQFTTISTLTLDLGEIGVDGASFTHEDYCLTETGPLYAIATTTSVGLWGSTSTTEAHSKWADTSVQTTVSAYSRVVTTQTVLGAVYSENSDEFGTFPQLVGYSTFSLPSVLSVYTTLTALTSALGGEFGSMVVTESGANSASARTTSGGTTKTSYTSLTLSPAHVSQDAVPDYIGGHGMLARVHPYGFGGIVGTYNPTTLPAYLTTTQSMVGSAFHTDYGITFDTAMVSESGNLTLIPSVAVGLTGEGLYSSSLITADISKASIAATWTTTTSTTHKKGTSVLNIATGTAEFATHELLLSGPIAGTFYQSEGLFSNIYPDTFRSAGMCSECIGAGKVAFTEPRTVMVNYGLVSWTEGANEGASTSPNAFVSFTVAHTNTVSIKAEPIYTMGWDRPNAIATVANQVIGGYLCQPFALDPDA